MKIRFHNIRWSVDCPSELEGLPDSVEMEFDSSFNPEMDGADALSDVYGFCVEGFNFVKN